jgi:hypothetical protein
MSDALNVHAPDELVVLYAHGMKDRRDKARIAQVDEWISANEDICDRWLWHLILDHRPAIEVLCGQSH